MNMLELKQKDQCFKQDFEAMIIKLCAPRCTVVAREATVFTEDKARELISKYVSETILTAMFNFPRMFKDLESEFIWVDESKAVLVQNDFRNYLVEGFMELKPAWCEKILKQLAWLD